MIYSELYDYFDAYLKSDSWQELEKTRKEIASKWKWMFKMKC